MNKILFINSVCTGSTGKICRDLYDLATLKGYECCIAFGRGKAPEGYKTIKIDESMDIYKSVLETRILDNHGFSNKKATLKFIEEVKKFDPDIVHLHNIHGYYLNVEILFEYLKKENKKVVWTLHDCWSFTGHCAHFVHENCYKWNTECYDCCNLKEYPSTFNHSKNTVRNNFKKKREVFTSLENMTLVTPSIWLKKLLQDSFLKKYRCVVINNGIDLHVFKSNEKNNVNEKNIILGVSNVWTHKKGLDTFIKLSSVLDSQNYQIILVGLNKKQIKTLPKSIIGIERTETIEELVDLYNQADVFFNPTLEDTYPTVNLEAQACGLPVITYNVGGAAETIFSQQSFVVKNIDAFLKLLKTLDIKQNKKDFYVDTRNLDKDIKLHQYIELYKEI